MIKKIVKRVGLIVAVIAIAVVSLLKDVNALPQSINLGEGSKTKDYIAGVSFHYKVSTEGDYLYCLDINKSVAKNVQANLVTNSSIVDGGLYYILKNGYPEKSITGDKDKDYYITQTAVWWYLDETAGGNNLGEYFKKTGSDVYNMRGYVVNLKNAGVQHKNDPLPTVGNAKLTLSTSNNSMTLNGEYYTSGDIKATVENITKYTITLEQAPDGTIIEREDGTTSTNKTMEINASQAFKIKVPAEKISSNDASIKINASATGTTQYEIGEYKPVNNTMQNVAMLRKSTPNATGSLNLTISSTSVSITKIDSKTRQPIAGAVLAVVDSEGNEVARWTSTINAHVIRNLDNGTYKLIEISAPQGYTKNNNEKTFTISDTNRNIELTFENTPKNVVVNITKIDQATGLPLAGATMQIKNADGEIVYKFVSSTTAEVITDLENGTYTLEEVAAPAGYIKNDKIVTFTIDDNHQSIQITYENAKETPVPDTASAPTIMIILGLLISGLGITYIRKHA